MCGTSFILKIIKQHEYQTQRKSENGLEIIMEKTQQYIWINGEFKLWDDANIHLMTHSLHYSGAVYEGMRAYNGNILLAEDHARRLVYSANALGLDFIYDLDDIIKYSYKVLEKNQLKNAYVRPLIWRENDTLKMFNSGMSTNFMIMALPSNKPMLNDLRLNVAKWLKMHPRSMDPQAKSSAHYAMAIVVQKDAKSLGFDDSIQLDHDGNVAECTVSNIFFAKGNKLYTPKSGNFLNGLTRQYIIKMANEIGLEAIEKDIKLDEIPQFDSCFMTGTSVEIASVKELQLQDEQMISFSNSIIPQLRKEFMTRVGKIEDA